MFQWRGTRDSAYQHVADRGKLNAPPPARSHLQAMREGFVTEAPPVVYTWSLDDEVAASAAPGVGAFDQWSAQSGQQDGGPGGRERNDVMQGSGVGMVEDACQVDARGGVRYAFDGYTYFEKHPTQRNACVFLDNAHERGLMDPGLTSCTKDTAWFVDPRFVNDVKAEFVEGRRRCTVALNPGMDASEYLSYEKRVRDTSIQRTVKFQELKALYDALLARYIALQEEVRRKRARLAELIAKENELRGRKAQLQVEVASAREMIVSKTRQLSNMQASYQQAQRDLEQARQNKENAQAALTNAQSQVTSANNSLSEAQSVAQALPPMPRGPAPEGSYKQTCEGCGVVGGQLVCDTCQTERGGKGRETRLPLPCNGDITNRDGTLRCE